jgi:hypothetical protein
MCQSTSEAVRDTLALQDVSSYGAFLGF